MPETKSTPTPSAPAPTPSSTPPGTTVTSATPPAASATASPPPASPTSAKEFRFPASPETPDWARGKTAEEVLSITQGYRELFERGTPTQVVPATAAPAPARGGLPNLSDDAILTGRDLRQYVDAYATSLAPQFQQPTELAASGNYGIASLKYQPEFKRWGPEIQLELAKVPKAYWTLDNINTIVDIVAGRHREDYARERAAELIATMEPTIRPTGGGSGPVPTPEQKAQSLESEAIPADWKVRAKQAGITESTIQEFCRTNDMTPEDFFKMFEKSPLQPIVAEVPHGR